MFTVKVADGDLLVMPTFADLSSACACFADQFGHACQTVSMFLGLDRIRSRIHNRHDDNRQRANFEFLDQCSFRSSGTLHSRWNGLAGQQLAHGTSVEQLYLHPHRVVDEHLTGAIHNLL